jgi:hypothetical protein
MAALQEQHVLGRAIANFSCDGVFPDEDEVSAMQVDDSLLHGTLGILASAKLDFEVSLQFAIF